MRNLLLLLLALCGLASHAQISFFDWDYPENPKDSAWYVIYDYTPPSVLRDCISLRDPGVLDKIVSEFGEKFPPEPLKVESLTDSLNSDILNKSRYFNAGYSPIGFEGRVLMTLMEYAGVESSVLKCWCSYCWPFAYDVIDSAPLLDWYAQNKDNIDLDLLGLYVAAELYQLDPKGIVDKLASEYYFRQQHYNHPLNTLEGDDEMRLMDMLLDDFFRLKPDERAFVERIIREHPNNEIIKQKLRYDKFGRFTRLVKSILKPDSAG